MAFTAIHPVLGRIDASRVDLGCGLDWNDVYRVRPRIALTCPECSFGVHAKLSPRGLPYFAHDPGRPPECQLSNESIEHHLLKLELATTIRAAGWHAELEVRAENGWWRADVMATSTDGARRWAWEAQLSPITDFELLERTAKYADADIDVCWVTPRDVVPWLGVGPSIRVEEPKGGAAWTVADGLARFDSQQGTWIVVANTSLETFVRWVLETKVTSHFIAPRYRRINLGKGRQARRNLLWTTDRSIQAEKQHDAMRERQETWKADKERKEQEAEQRRKAEEQAQREERERQRKIEEEARRAEAAEKHRLWMIEWEKQRQQREAERIAREEAERKAEAERQERERQAALAQAERDRLEQEAAALWWAEVSPTQLQELLAAIAQYSMKRNASRAAPEQLQAEVRYGYGIALHAGGKLYGVVRPHPGSLHRLAVDLKIFVRSTREAEQILAHGNIDSSRVIHFDLPDHEQMALC